MQGEFEMSIMSELNYFSDLQIKQGEKDIIIHRNTHTKEMLKKFSMLDIKVIKTLIHTSRMRMVGR